MSVSCLVAPVGVCDQSAAHTDQIRVAPIQDVLSHLGIADVSDSDGRFVEFVTDSLCHVGAPSVLQIVGVDLVLDGGVQGGGGVEHVHTVI